MATHSSVLAWIIPGMGKPGGLPSMGSHKVGQDWSDLAAAAAAWHFQALSCGEVFFQVLTNLLMIWMIMLSEKAMAPHSSTLAWKSPWMESLVGCSPWGRWGSNMTERLPFHFSLSCIGEGNGNPLQCSCLENPRDGEAWWAAVYGVTQSRTWLKWLSNSNSNDYVVSYLWEYMLLLT